MVQEFKDLQIVLDSEKNKSKSLKVRKLKKKLGIKPKEQNTRRGKSSRNLKARISVSKKPSIPSYMTARSV